MFSDESHWLNQPNPVLGFFFYGFIAFITLFPYKFFVSITVRFHLNACLLQ